MQKVNKESGSIMIATLFGTILLMSSMILLYRFYNAKIFITKEVNSNISERNTSSLLFSYFSNENICSKYFLNKSLKSDLDLENIFYTIGKDENLKLSNDPFVEIMSKVKNISLQKTLPKNTGRSIMTKLYYIYQESNESLPRSEYIDMQVDLNANLEIQNCMARFFLKENESDCNKKKNGTLRFSTNLNIPERCDGQSWQPAVNVAGMYGVFVNKNQQAGKCATENKFTGDCSCPEGFEPSLAYDFESKNCEWKYYWPESPGCGYKVFECVKK